MNRQLGQGTLSYFRTYIYINYTLVFENWRAKADEVCMLANIKERFKPTKNDFDIKIDLILKLILILKLTLKLKLILILKLIFNISFCSFNIRESALFIMRESFL